MLVVNPQYESLRPWLETLPEIFDSSGEIIYDARNQIRRMSAPDGTLLCVKRFRRPAWPNRIIYTFLRPSKAQRAYDNAFTLLQHQVPTPAPVAYLLFRSNGLLSDAYLVTSFCPFRRSFYELGEGGLDGREDLVRAFAVFSARLHQEGILHLDYSPGNILFDGQDGRWSFCLVDINRLRIGGPVSWCRGCRGFGRLWGTPAMMRLLADSYAEARGVDPVRCERLVLRAWRRFWRFRHPAFPLYD